MGGVPVGDGYPIRIMAVMNLGPESFYKGSVFTDEKEIERYKTFDIELNGEKTPVAMDYIINIDGRRLMVIKCSPGALDSRQRHIVSFARVVDSYQIPLAVATDG
ncbi:MAG: hypothetical protein QXZ06_07655, partial [Candidatus Jordarchaeales archaeon]